MRVATTGALSGWKRTSSEGGIVLTLQIAGSAEAFAKRDLEVARVALNDRQLRSLARDLTRAATERGFDLFSRPPWWRRLFGRSDQQRSKRQLRA